MWLVAYGFLTINQVPGDRGVCEASLHKPTNKTQSGFTLIELLVVVAILGVLAAIAIPNIANFVQEGDRTAIQANTAAIQTAADAFAIRNGAYPTDEAGLKALVQYGYLRSWPDKGNYTITHGMVKGE
jgi:prepilin-type N-terminal cleavage/methylation domain-containing protein